MSFYDEISSNKKRTIGLFAIYVLFIFFLVFALAFVFFGGDFVFASSISLFVGFFLIIYGLVSLKYSKEIALKVSGAVKANPDSYKQLYNVVEELSIAAGIPMPEVYIVNDPAPNAFATGSKPEHSAVAVTTGLLTLLNREELSGVIAHELSHIKNYDIRVSSLAAVFAGFTVIISDIIFRSLFWGSFRSSGSRDSGNAQIIFVVVAIVLAIISPIIAKMIQFAISRNREFLADSSAVQITRNPLGLISALSKLDSDKHSIKNATHATAHMYIEDPFKDKSFLSNMFSTHPPIEVRIKKLQSM